jgi:hypothetical protein
VLIDDVVAAVDVERLAGDEAGGVVRQEGGGDAGSRLSERAHEARGVSGLGIQLFPLSLS